MFPVRSRDDCFLHKKSQSVRRFASDEMVISATFSTYVITQYDTPLSVVYNTKHTGRTGVLDQSFPQTPSASTESSLGLFLAPSINSWGGRHFWIAIVMRPAALQLTGFNTYCESGGKRVSNGWPHECYTEYGVQRVFRFEVGANQCESARNSSTAAPRLFFGWHSMTMPA